MIKLNIIPQEIKREIIIAKKIKIYFKFLNIIIINFIIYSLIFLALKIIMQNYYNDTKNQTILENKSTGDYQAEVKGINDQIKYIKNIQDDFVYWSDFFAFLSENKSKGIIYKQIKVSKDEDMAIFLATASTRNDLLAFKKSLEESQIFSDINLPFSSLLEKNDINFEIKAKILSYEF